MALRIVFAGATIIAAVSSARAQSTVSVWIYSKYNFSCVDMISDSTEPVHVNAGSAKGLMRITAAGDKIQLMTADDASEHDSLSIHADKARLRVVPESDVPIRAYEGTIRVKAHDGRLTLLNDVPVERYVAAVMAGEASDMRSREALLAMAVVIRSYSCTRKKPHEAEGFDFCDLTHCQLYRGFSDVPASTEKLTAATAGHVLEYHGRVIEAYYHACCGGRTESGHFVWAAHPPPYLTSVSDKDPKGEKCFCSRSPWFHWRAKLTSAEMTDVARGAQWIRSDEKVVDVQVKRRSGSGRVQALWFVTPRRRVAVYGRRFYQAVGRTLGWEKIRSTWFEIPGNTGKARTVYRISGRGYGHGVGFCQSGADGMARRGFTMRQILQHYFPETMLVNIEE